MPRKQSPSSLLSEIGDLLAKRDEADKEIDKLCEQLLPAVPDENLRFIAVGYSYTRRVVQLQRHGDILDVEIVASADEAGLAFPPEPEPEQASPRPPIEVGDNRPYANFEGVESAEFGPPLGMSLAELETETA